MALRLKIECFVVGLTKEVIRLRLDPVLVFPSLHLTILALCSFCSSAREPHICARVPRPFWKSFAPATRWNICLVGFFAIFTIRTAKCFGEPGIEFVQGTGKWNDISA
jgi:hypothetical protein